MAWMTNPREMFCCNRDEFLKFVEDNYITAYHRAVVKDVLCLKNVLITGINRKLASLDYIKGLNDDGVVFPEKLVKFGFFFKTSDCQIIYMFSSELDRDKIEMCLDKSWQIKNDVTVKVMDKEENFLHANHNLVIVALQKKVLPILN